MEHRHLGRSGLSISEIAYGNWVTHGSQVAEDAGDHAALAESALGLGGVWLAEHRGSEDRQRYDALLRRALAAVAGTEEVLHGRLQVRLAAEEAYQGERPIADVTAAVARVRAMGDPRAHAEGLSLLHHTMLGPAYAVSRLVLAEELVRTASRCGDGTLTVMGLLWRTVDLFLLGRPEGAPERPLPTPGAGRAGIMPGLGRGPPGRGAPPGAAPPPPGRGMPVVLPAE